jgi:sporulation protein YlmC with PRC-barrel domain
MTDFMQDQLEGSTVEGSDGVKLGKVSGVFLDAETNKPEWIVVKTGLFGSKEALLPLAAASATGDTITVPYTKDQVKDAPTRSSRSRTRRSYSPTTRFPTAARPSPRRAPRGSHRRPCRAPREPVTTRPVRTRTRP